MDVRADAEPPAGWEALARRAGSFYHHPDWIAALSRCFAFRMHYLTAHDGGELVGILPLAVVPTLTGRRRLVSLPFSYAAGIAAAEPPARVELAAASLEIAQRERAARIELKQLGAAVPPPDRFTRAERYATFRVLLAPGKDPLEAASASFRRAARQAERAGVRMEERADEAGWLLMAELQEATSHRLGVPPPPRRFFTSCCRDLQRAGLAELRLALSDAGHVVAGMVLWKGHDAWIYAFGAARVQERELRPIHALVADGIRRAARAGVAFDLGRAAPEQEGLVEFKRRWGAQPVPLAYDYWPHPAGVHTAPRHRGGLAVAARLWSAIPAPLARRGAFLYRYLG